MNGLANNPPPPSDRDNRKNPQEDPKKLDPSHKSENKTIKSNFINGLMLSSFLFIIGIVVIFFLVIKKRKN